jgi:aspartate carbamoyltransferase regulatory subunit
MPVEELFVRKIRNGTVIDHIPGGQALNVLKILKIRGGEGYTVAMAMNLKSKKLGRKDLIKIEDRELASDEVDMIALVAPEATINTIRNYRVTRKMKVKLPDRIGGILKCTNSNCISNKPGEPLKPSFKVFSRAPALLVCDYCGTYISHDEIVSQYAL